MSPKLLFVPLLMATGLVLADDVSEVKRDNGAVERQPQSHVREAESDTDPEQAKADESAPEAKHVEGADAARAQTKENAKLISGMSILGNQEAPKSLVIVPWKNSVLGDSLGISMMLDDSKRPVDREVFMRALSYYEIRSKTKL